MTQEKSLRIAFLAGAVTDALAIVPMLLSSLAMLLWGCEDVSGAYWFAMGYGASLMLGWTVLLIWAYQRPIERRVFRPFFCTFSPVGFITSGGNAGLRPNSFQRTRFARR